MLVRLAYLAVSNAFTALRLLPLSDRDKNIEILALRHQISVLRRRLGAGRPRFEPADRALPAALLAHVPRETLRSLRLIMRPGTVLRSQAEAILACGFLETVALSGQCPYVLAVIEHATRRIRVLGTTVRPTAAWVTQAARNLVMDLDDAGATVRHLIRDGDAKFPALFDEVLAATGIAIVLTESACRA